MLSAFTWKTTDSNSVPLNFCLGKARLPIQYLFLSAHETGSLFFIPKYEIYIYVYYIIASFWAYLSWMRCHEQSTVFRWLSVVSYTMKQLDFPSFLETSLLVQCKVALGFCVVSACIQWKFHYCIFCYFLLCCFQPPSSQFQQSILLVVHSFTFYSLTCSSMYIYELWRSSSNNLIASRQSSQMDHYFQCLKICISFPVLFYSLAVNYWISIDFWNTVEWASLNHVFGQRSILHIVVLPAVGAKKACINLKTW